jgi:hypothetical protein
MAERLLRQVREFVHPLHLKAKSALVSADCLLRGKFTNVLMIMLNLRLK